MLGKKSSLSRGALSPTKTHVFNDENADVVSERRKRDLPPRENSSNLLKKRSRTPERVLSDVQVDPWSSKPVISDDSQETNETIQQLKKENEELKVELNQEREKSRLLSTYLMECIESNDKLTEEVDGLKKEVTDLRSQNIEYSILYRCVHEV
ncbi:hypothetical protein WA588_004545 [Blastocystis sp. NMH]